MRTLLLLRGAPGCGKSTFIHNNGLDPFVLSADTIRMQCSCPIFSRTGTISISPKNDKTVWKILFQMLELRMRSGSFTVIDATNSKTTEMNRYKSLCKTYRYRIFLVDFTDIPMEVCKTRNAGRATVKRVPESVIETMYARFATQKVPSGITILKPHELPQIFYHESDLNPYKQIHIIGDIHGCYTALKECLSDSGGLQDDSYYILCGDYLDRGLENAHVFQFLYSLMDKPNVCLLEGNHERWLQCYGHEQKSLSAEFEENTRIALACAGITPKQARIFYSHLRQCAYFSYNIQGKSTQWIVTHGGLSALGCFGLLDIPTEQMIYGVGQYEDVPCVLQAWTKDNDKYQVFGHRNIQNLPINADTHSFLLEGGVERGGDLRSLILTHDAAPMPKYTPNTVFRVPGSSADSAPDPIPSVNDIANLTKELRSCGDVRESVQDAHAEISSFNFTRKAFCDGRWNQFTTLARGLFIDTKNNRIVCRGYEKFFRVDELARVYKNIPHPDSGDNLAFLQEKLSFPVEVYIKENGFLGLLSYSKETKDLCFATKSSMSGAYAKNFREIFIKCAFPPQDARWGHLAAYLRDSNETLLFEVVDPVNDPHIIEYDKPCLYLLDAVRNEIDFRAKEYDLLVQLADSYGFTPKAKYAKYDNWTSFLEFYSAATANDFLVNGSPVEGFVIRDANGFMTKIKTAYYSFWKFMRSVSYATLKYGQYHSTGTFSTPLANYFYAFLRDKYKNDPLYCIEKTPFSGDIISLRKEFYQLQKAGDPHSYHV